MNQIMAISTYLLAILRIAAGIIHFVNPAFFLKVMPPYLSLHKELVFSSRLHPGQKPSSVLFLYVRILPPCD